MAALRPRPIDASRPPWAVLQRLGQRIHAAWPAVKITIRGARGFGSGKLRRGCVSPGLGSGLGLARNPVVERAAWDGLERARRHLRRTGPPQRLFGSCADAAARWDRPRRGLVKAEPTTPKSNPRIVVANVPGDPPELDEAGYGQRGEMENRLKEPQGGCGPTG